MMGLSDTKTQTQRQATSLVPKKTLSLSLCHTLFPPPHPHSLRPPIKERMKQRERKRERESYYFSQQADQSSFLSPGLTVPSCHYSCFGLRTLVSDPLIYFLLDPCPQTIPSPPPRLPPFTQHACTSRVGEASPGLKLQAQGETRTVTSQLWGKLSGMLQEKTK